MIKLSLRIKGGRGGWVTIPFPYVPMYHHPSSETTILSLEMIFIGKPGVRSMGPLVCPSQTNKQTDVCKT